MAAGEERQICDAKDAGVHGGHGPAVKAAGGGGTKTVQFMNNSEQCDKYPEQKQGHVAAHVDNAIHSSNPTINMVQNLVPHLPGLDKDKVYVISGEQYSYKCH